MDETTTVTAVPATGDVPWRGVNHLALITNDMDATVRFWHGVLDARLVATIGAPTFRHYFFSFGDQTTVAFFEYRGHDTLQIEKPAGVFDARAGHFDHLSLDVPDEAALLALRDRLTAHGCGVTEVVDHHMIRSIYFTDPNGIALEASWWVIDANHRASNYSDHELFHDDDPVPAVIELRGGGLRSTPTTRLAGDEANVVDGP